MLVSLQKKAKKSKGFTLIELMVVIAIIAILVMVAMPDLKSTIFGSKVTAAQSNIKVIGDATLKYYTEMGTLPDAGDITSLREILVNKKDFNGQSYGPWLKKNMDTKDPWGNEYKIEFESDGDFDIISSGPDSSDSSSEIRYTTLGNKNAK